MKKMLTLIISVFLCTALATFSFAWENDEIKPKYDDVCNGYSYHNMIQWS